MFDISPDLSNGVRKQILKEGEGDEYPGYGDKVSVHYTGWLMSNREVFDSTRKGESVEFSLGRGQVIKGWDVGLATMKKGEVALFIVEPQYAYGEAGYPPVIPPYSPLLFEVELCDWRMEDLSFKKDNGILRKILAKGEGTTCPNDGSSVKVKLVGSYDDKIFEDTEKEFILGEGCILNIPEGVEVALLRFHLKEKSMIYLKSQYAFEKGSDEYDIPPDADVQYVVTLLEFEKAKDVWEMDSDEKLSRAKACKEKGISFIQAGKIRAALKQFRWILVCLEKEPGVSSDTEDERKSLLLSSYLNSALCLLKLEHYIEAIKICDKALEIDPESEKGLFRRGQAKMLINDCSEALEDFEKLINLYPENKVARQSRLLCHEKMKNQSTKDKKVYSKMFEKFVKQDEERIRNMKTETGVWEDNEESNENKLSDSSLDQNKKLYEQHGAVLRDANVVELSNTACL
ncbi:peptidyl-prolyl cis-trans isomerase FKBP4 [Parasteatoda tepidariorum]|uniref:peptidyl-prolyl cis-trans isomerase FKBP4 n=1 Tax=Parasteatoda tepidariorum TaxID=114398 RepID=UPI0039BD0711